VREPDTGWVTVAVLGRTRGIRGEITAVPLSGKPERFQQLRQATLYTSGGALQPVEVESSWFHDRTLVLKFRGIGSISDVEPFIGAELRIPLSERVELEEGEFFQSDLIGCEVVDRRSGEPLGHVAAWQDAGGSGLLELDGGLLIPFVRAICVEIDPAARRIGVLLPEGLKDVNRP
jgi:16S rRNA processing protein RimM